MTERAETPDGMLASILSASGEEQQWLTRILGLSSAAIAIVEPDLTYSYVNRAFVTLFGYPREELLGRAVTELWARDPTRVVETVTRDGVADAELEVARRDGTRLVVRCSAMQLQEGASSPGPLLVSLSDVTRQFRAEEALRHRLALEETVARISTGLMRASADEADEQARRKLGELAQAARADAAAILLLADGRVDRIAEWSASGVAPKSRVLSCRPLADVPRAMAKLRKGEVVHFSRREDFPPESDTEARLLAETDFEAVVLVPLLAGTGLLGLLVFGREHETERWSDEDLRLFRLAGEIVAAMLALQATERQLRRERDLVRGLFEASPDAILVSDVTGAIIDCNEAALRMGHQASRAAVVGRGIFEYFDRDDLPRVIEGFGRVLRDGTARAEYTALGGGGHKLPVEVAGGLIRDSQGLPVGAVGIVRDLTESKRAEQALQESQARFRSLVENTGDWIWEVDASGVYTYTSPQVRPILGYDPEEILGKALFDLMPATEAARVRAMFADIAAKQAPIVRLENMNLHKSGRQVVLETNGMPFFSEDGTLLGYRCVDRDITQRKEAEAELRLTDAALANSITGIALSDLAGSLTFANAALARMFGCELETMIGRPITEFLPETAGDVFAELERADSWSGELAVERRDGTSIVMQIVLNLVRDVQDKPLTVIGSFVDVTARKQVEEALALARRTIERELSDRERE
jgi:PAS domain S-box-containing protein